MAKRSGLSKTTIGRIWKAFELKPHRVDGFKLSKDPLFVEKVYDVVGLYLDPPESAVVLCVDEKSQVQALARTSPVLPMMPGMPERRTHDYVRHGVTNLFAAFNTADGTVISSIHRRHRAIEFKKCLAKIDDEVPDDLEVHLVCDNPLASAQRLERGREVTQGRGLVPDALPGELTRMPCDVLADLDDVVDVALRVGPPGDGQPHQVEGSRNL